ncbi:putative calcium-binding protein precursor cnx1 [Trichodelitschia bisporula]|uniref:Putative calcium-binding protein cnx1 n=1 Tax=Trichodelitschia bisporula TaxID=703511 RepID=A0A6G1I6I4_9PEZI|nr:putative calcium-binding protein precursor cnx1 [Trichodelitschia bisporula]
MRITQLAAAAALCATAYADVTDDIKEAASEIVSSATSIVKPTFTPTSLKAPFLEQFTDDWESRWKASHAKKQNDKSSEEEWAYIGNWAVEEPTVLAGTVGDKGLVVKDKAAHHAISAKFPKPINPKGKPLVVQYEVKLQDGLECGGAYLKLLQENKKLHLDEFSNASPYIIMFGPDKCGATNKVHFIFRHKNPKTGEYEEKHLNNPPMARTVKTTTLYTLIVHPNNTFAINIDGEEAKSGSLLEDFTPSVNPEKEIDDPKDKKPEDWVDEARIADPDAKKPEDWDEDAPFEIVDEEATKPADWLDDEPTMIPDPEAEKPEDWDDEEDGDWVAPQVPNPKCSEASGCGKWEPPMKSNPAYKGKWTAPFIDNPKYKGVWKPRKIANPDYYEDKHPANFEPMGAIGFELWTMQNNMLFDNIYVGHSFEDANKLREETFEPKVKAEKAEEDATKPKEEDPKADTPETPVTLKEDPIKFITQKVEKFMAIAKVDVLEAFKTVPEVGGTIFTVALVFVSILLTMLTGGGAPAPAQVKAKAKEIADKVADKTKDAKDKAAEAVATGAQNAKGEAQKRKA